MGHVGVVVAHADVALGDLVLGRIALELGQGLHFGHGGADTKRPRTTDGGGDRLLNQIVQALGTHGGEQGPQFFLTRADMTADEIGFCSSSNSDWVISLFPGNRSWHDILITKT